MFVGTSMENSPALLVPVISLDSQSEGLDSSLPCWVPRAQHDLAQRVAELRQLQERHVTETEAVKRGIERAILGCRREERRLLERVEQDHRDTQQRLEQVQKENLAAARVSMGLLDQRLCKLVQLQQQVQEAAPLVLNDSSANQNLLLKEVAEFLQPWEISVSLKKVNFKPSPQPNAVVFGEIHVQEQSLSLHVGGCGRQGQMCSLHSQAMKLGDTTNKCSGRKPKSKDQDWTSPAGRVIKKISLSNQSDLELEEEQTMSSAKISQWLPKCQQPDWESCQEDKVDTAYLQQQGKDKYMAVSTNLKDMDNKSRDPAYIMSSDELHCCPRNPRKMLGMAGRKPSPSPERRRDRVKLGYSLSLDRQESDKRKIIQESSTDNRFLRYGSTPHTCPRLAQRQSQASQSCLDLTSTGRSHSRLSQSSDEHSLGTQGDSGRAPSPADSLDSSYTFIVSPSHHEYSINRGSLSYSCRLSRSAVDLTHKTYPLITAGSNGHGEWKSTNINSRSRTTSPPNRKGPRVADTKKYKAYNTLPQRKATAAEVVKSAICSSAKETKEAREERGEPALVVLEEEDDLSFTDFSTPGVHLISQFGKQGSGRSDLTLPSGIHAMSQGQMFIVDCGD
ncbi:uncharacterized protein LOC114455691 [Gouania willdenowi]|uniref:uncharacterized protein LOC114455691 n=1 Tax=Gouania willdenowi TaxID=441366 RepID=UPI0010568C38|nr:uncharacterized protein LOC114455691 [Gouania willdenowi]